MKKLDIFIASSIVEFSSERERFVIVMGRLHDYLYEHNLCNLVISRCEDFEYSILKTGTGTQDKLNDQIKNSDLTLFFFGEKIGSVSKEELDIAYNNYLITTKSKPFVFFMKNSSSHDAINYKYELLNRNIPFMEVDNFDEIIVKTIFYINHTNNFNLDFRIYKDKLWIDDEYIIDNISSSIKIDIIYNKEHENKVINLSDSDKLRLYSAMDNINYHKKEVK